MNSQLITHARMHTEMNLKSTTTKVQLSNNKYFNGILTWLDCNQRSYIWIFGWTLRKDVQLACAQMPELFFDLNVPFQLSAKKQNKKFVQMYTGTRLTTAIHRRLLS